MATHYVNQVAPVNLYSPRTNTEMAHMANGHNADEFFTFTVGKLDAGMAILIGDRASQIEFPSLLLPNECTTGSVVRISVSRNQAEELRKKREFDQVQEDILETFGRIGPKAPSLNLRAVTQTSITLEWDRLELATSKLLTLDIFRNNERLAAIPNPLHNTSTKLSGLEVDRPYSFHLVLRTTAGTSSSNVIRTKTHNMSDTSGISVCFGYMEGSEPETDSGERQDGELEAKTKSLIEGMGAKWSDKIQIDTTHFVCTSPRSRSSSITPGNNPATKDLRGAMYVKASQLSIPVVQPHWVFACAEQKKMVPISHFYLDKEPPNAAQIRSSLSRKTEAAAAAGATTEAQQVSADEAAIAENPEQSADPALPVPTTSVGELAQTSDSPADNEGRAEDSSAVVSGHDDTAAVDSAGPTGDESEPPLPAAKDSPPLVATEAEPNASVSGVDGPVTTTVATAAADDEAVPSYESSAAVADKDHTAAEDEAEQANDTVLIAPSESAGSGLTAGDDKMDEISLGGESSRDANEEIDLS